MARSAFRIQKCKKLTGSEHFTTTTTTTPTPTTTTTTTTTTPTPTTTTTTTTTTPTPTTTTTPTPTTTTTTTTPTPTTTTTTTSRCFYLLIFLESYVQLHSVPDMEMESEFISSQVSPTKVGHFVAI